LSYCKPVTTLVPHGPGKKQISRTVTEDGSEAPKAPSAWNGNGEGWGDPLGSSQLVLPETPSWI